MQTPNEVITWLEGVRDDALRMEQTARVGFKLAVDTENRKPVEQRTGTVGLTVGSEQIRWYRLAMEADALAAIIARDGSHAFIHLDVRIAAGSEDAARAEGVELKPNND